MLWRVVRRLLAVGIRLFVWHPVVTLVVAVVAIGAVGFSMNGANSGQVFSGPSSTASIGSLSPGTAAAASSSAATPVAVRPAPQVRPSPAVQQYIQGMVAFNAHQMWQSLSPTAIQAMTSQGGSEEVLQQKLDEARQQGAAYDDVTYFGGYPLKDGTEYFFYVVSRRGFSAPNTADQEFFVFTVGPDGKILAIQ
jgi:hypothetical protein